MARADGGMAGYRDVGGAARDEVEAEGKEVGKEREAGGGRSASCKAVGSGTDSDGWPGFTTSPDLQQQHQRKGVQDDSTYLPA
jgi:hypothetical protein